LGVFGTDLGQKAFILNPTPSERIVSSAPLDDFDGICKLLRFREIMPQSKKKKTMMPDDIRLSCEL
jgi:hypothetical protein